MENITLVVIFGMLCILANTFAAPAQLQSSSCETLSYSVQKAGAAVQRHQIRSQDLHNFCTTVSSDLATTVRLTSPSNPACHYEVIKFSEEGCDDDETIAQVPLNTEHPETVLNRRKPICSYKLETSVSSPAFVTVKFTQVGGQTTSHKMNGGCVNLCNGPSGTYYPRSVGVYKGDTTEVVEDNHITLFSKLSCEDNSEINDTNGNVIAAKKENDLASLTRVSSQSPVRSFKIMKL